MRQPWRFDITSLFLAITVVCLFVVQSNMREETILGTDIPTLTGSYLGTVNFIILFAAASFYKRFGRRAIVCGVAASAVATTIAVIISVWLHI
jgi:hypothetical protein